MSRWPARSGGRPSRRSPTGSPPGRRCSTWQTIVLGGGLAQAGDAAARPAAGGAARADDLPPGAAAGRGGPRRRGRLPRRRPARPRHVWRSDDPAGERQGGDPDRRRSGRAAWSGRRSDHRGRRVPVGARRALDRARLRRHAHPRRRRAHLHHRRRRRRPARRPTSTCAHGTTTLLASLVSSPVRADARRPPRRSRRWSTRACWRASTSRGRTCRSARCGAQNPEYLRDPSTDELTELIELGGGRGPDGHPRPGARRRAGGDQAAHRARGWSPRSGTPTPRTTQTRAAVAAGASVGTHLFNGMRPVHHREPGPVVALLDAPDRGLRAGRRRGAPARRDADLRHRDRRARTGPR